MSEGNGKEEPGSADAARKRFLLGQKREKALAHLAFLQRELLEAETSVNNGLRIELLVEANQRLVLAALSAPVKSVIPSAEELPELYQQIREANEHLVVAALHAQKLQAHAEQALARQKSALASVAHEMRNPLTPISMLAERMVQMPPEKLPEMCALIESQVQHLSRMVEDLLDVSRASTGKLSLNVTQVDLGRILREAIDGCSTLMSAKNLHFAADIPAGPLMANGDRVRISQIFSNVLTNAIKYTPSGGHVRVVATVRSATLHVCVSDTGIGISPQAIPVIFEPYVQDAQAVGFNGSGLGIGLTVVRELVEAHGGSVTGVSEGIGKGSQFTVLFPLLKAQVD